MRYDLHEFELTHIKQYLQYGAPPSNRWRRILLNEYGRVGRFTSMHQFVDDFVPAEAKGTAENVSAWIKQRGLSGASDETQVTLKLSGVLDVKYVADLNALNTV